jgi:heme A synthase
MTRATPTEQSLAVLRQVRWLAWAAVGVLLAACLTAIIVRHFAGEPAPAATIASHAATCGCDQPSQTI